MKTPDKTKAALEALKRIKVFADESTKNVAPFLRNLKEKLDADFKAVESALTPQAVTGQREMTDAEWNHLLQTGGITITGQGEKATVVIAGRLRATLTDPRDAEPVYNLLVGRDNAVAALLQQQPEGEKCEECQGAGEVFTHRMDCYDDLCALNGDIHSCTGVVVPCPSCATRPQQPAQEHDSEWFFRWIARGKAGYNGMTMEQCADMIWHSPANPYRENNPWSSAPPTAE